MKKFSLWALLLMFSIIGLQSCKEDSQLHEENTSLLYKNTSYNKNLKKLSIALSEAVRDNINFRELLKNEALLMFDGDYDILMNKIKDMPVNGIKGGVRVSELLSSYIVKDKQNVQSRTNSDFINQLVQDYPDLQVSIPVHADDWNTESYIPKVAFMPEEYNEKTNLQVASYLNGEEEPIDAVNPPNNPVIVVSLCERTINGVIVENYNPSIAGAPEVDINLSISTFESGIMLSWAYTPNTGGTIEYYNIYRKKAGDPNFVLYAINNGLNNRIFFDTDVIDNVYYSYYVVAANNDGSSNASNIATIQAPITVPDSTLSFDAIHLAQNDTELRWTNDFSNYFDNTKIYKRVIGVDNSYNLLGTYTIGTYQDVDTNLTPGKRINYKIHQYTASNSTLSNPKFDFVQVPYRDISQPSNVYIEKIKFDDWSIEGWLAGKPEFKLTVASVNPTSNSSYGIQDNVEFNFCHRHSWNNFNNKLMLPWDPNNWYQMLSFNLVEYDRNRGNLEINLGVKYKNKKSDKTGFQPTAGVNYKISIDKKDEQCGSGYLNYYDVEEGWIYFPNYGARIYYSTVDVIEDCDTN